MLVNHHVLGKTFNTSKLHILAIQDLQHTGAYQTNNAGHPSPRQHEGRQNEVVYTAPAKGRKPAQNSTEQQDEHNSHPEMGSGNAQHREELAEMVYESVTFHCR